MENMKTIICGPAASGKNTLCNRLSEKLSFSPPCTTRPKREGEEDGNDYYFMDKVQFNKHLVRGEFHCWNSYNGWYYGYLKEQIEYSSLFIFPPAFLYQLKDYTPGLLDDILIIFLDIDPGIRYQRLKQRSDPNDKIDRRFNADQRDFNEFRESGLFDIKITNPDF